MRSGLARTGLTALLLTFLAAGPALADEPTVAKIGVLTDFSGPYGDAAGKHAGRQGNNFLWRRAATTSSCHARPDI